MIHASWKMSLIVSNLLSLKEKIPASVKIVAVSKTKPAEDILEAYNAGHKSFGENRVQELLSKKDLLPDDIEWHLIGHLQSNKVRSVVPFVSMIHSVDSMKLLKIIDSESLQIRRKVNCLLQIHIAKEETKYGFSMPELRELINNGDLIKIGWVNICGVMGMATFTDDTGIILEEFRYLKSCFMELKAGYFRNDDNFREISMGMSDDYMLAIGEGSTIVRIGTLIFGERNKTN